MQLDFNMPVVADDGLDAGALERVLVDRGRCAVTHVVVRAPFASEDLLLSLDLVQGTDGGRLRVRPGRDELFVMPRYYEGRTSDPPEGRVDTSQVPEPPERRQELDRALGISEETVELGPETRVTTTDDAEAQLVGVGSNEPGNDIARVRLRGPAGAETDVPASWIDVMREDVVTLRVRSEDVLRSRPSPRLRGGKDTDLEGLSGMGGLGGETREEELGPDFVDELTPKEDMVSHARHPGSVPQEHEGSGIRGGRT